jgi:hypothetical protein
MNAAAICGIAQAVLKGLKEVATGLIDIFSLFTATAVAQQIVVKVRDRFNKIDEQIEKAKTWLLANIK